MASFFWDMKGIINIDFLREQGTTNVEYYYKLLKTQQKRPSEISVKHIILSVSYRIMHLVKSRSVPFFPVAL